MSRLTSYAKPPKARAGAASPHQYRLLGGRVLVTDELGRWALLSAAEHARLLAGLSPGDPLYARLQPLGFVAGAYDFDADARRRFERGPLSWKGAAAHVLLLDGPAGAMGLDAVLASVDCAFRCPGPQVTLELVCADAAARWPEIWFATQYARRRGEWARRPTFLVARAESMTPEHADFLRGHGATRRASLVLDGAPKGDRPPPFRAQRALARLAPGAREPRAWARWFERWGFESVRLLPAAADGDGSRGFHAFHGEFLDELISLGDEGRVRDEWALAFLAGRPWSLPGADLVEELAHDASGRVFPSEAAALDPAGLSLGTAAALRWQDLPASEAVRALVAASMPDNQPQCSQCVYRSFCAVPPSVSRREQGGLWGRMPESAECALRMGILDRFFTRMDDEKWLLLLDKWHVDMR